MQKIKSPYNFGRSGGNDTTFIGAPNSLGYRLFLNSSRNAVAISRSVTPASKSSFAIFLSVYPALILSMTHALNCRVSLPRTLPTLLLIFHPNLLIFRSLQFCFLLFIFNSNYTQYIMKFSSWKNTFFFRFTQEKYDYSPIPSFLGVLQHQYTWQKFPIVLYPYQNQ